MEKQQNVVVGDNIRAELVRRRLNQGHLARHLGITPQAVGLKLAGKRPLSVGELQATAELLGIHPGQLFDQQQVPA